MTPRTDPARRAEAGVTLIELVVAIAVSAVIAGMVTAFMQRPMNAYADARARAVLVDSADAALSRMKREVRLALPNSARISPDGSTLEILHVVDAARYRRGPGTNPVDPNTPASPGADHSAASDWLAFTTTDAQWNVLGRFKYLTFAYGTALASNYRIAIYPTGSSIWTQAAAGTSPAAITPNGTSITIANDVDEDAIQLSSAFQFTLESPRQRMYVVDGPITYRCDTGAETLTRYAGYLPTAAQPTDPTVSPLVGASAALLAGSVATCAFRYDAGTATRAGLVSLALGLAQGTEQVSLLDQAHVENSP